MPLAAFVDDTITAYREAELPPEPALRLAALRAIVERRLGTLSVDDRVAVAEELEGLPPASPTEEERIAEVIVEREDGLVDAIVAHVRAELPELSVPEV
jgi:hypothetical protein